MKASHGEVTDQPNSETPQSVISALLASGFPFQTAVASIVRGTNGYTLAGEEVAWKDEMGNDQFLDLVAERGHVFLPIECKKTQKEMLTFLRPSPARGDEARARCAYLTQVKDSTRRLELFCSEWQLTPRSPSRGSAWLALARLGRINGCWSGIYSNLCAALMHMRDATNRTVQSTWIGVIH